MSFPPAIPEVEPPEDEHRITSAHAAAGKTLEKITTNNYEIICLHFTDETFLVITPDYHEGITGLGVSSKHIDDSDKCDLEIISKEEYQSREKARKARWKAREEELEIAQLRALQEKYGKLV